MKSKKQKIRQFNGFVYFIGNLEEGKVKIGFSRNPEKRLRELQTAESNPLTLMKTIKGNIGEEKKYQNLFCWYRIRKGGGREWYILSEEIKQFLSR